MPDEKNYVGTLLDIENALPLLYGFEAHIMRVSYLHWRNTVEIERGLLNSEADRRPRSRHHSIRRTTATEGSNSGPGASVGN
jgi:hypothetical protein